MNVDIKNDISKLLSIDKLYVDRLFNKVIWCLSDYTEKAIKSGEKNIDVDFGFGTISINLEEDCLRYRFKPSKELEKVLINTISNDQNELDLVLEKNLVQKLTNLYKDMF